MNVNYLKMNSGYCRMYQTDIVTGWYDSVFTSHLSCLSRIACVKIMCKNLKLNRI